MIKKLRLRFIRLAAISVSAVLVLLGLILNTANFLSVNAEQSQMLEAIYQNQGKAPSAPPTEHLGGGQQSSFSPETPYTTRYFVLRYLSDGTLIRADLSNIAAVTEDTVGDYLAIAKRHGTGYGFTGGYKFLVVCSGGDRYMAIFLDCHDSLQGLVSLGLLTAVAIGVCVLLVLIAVSLFSRRAIEPVVKSIEQQKQFITDASHELKTPITVIATSLKVLEMETGPQKWIDKARSQTEKLGELVNQLVTLSRLDEGETPLQPRPFPLSEAVDETAEAFRDFALCAGHPLELSIAPQITYTGDEYALRQLVSILLDNAIRYADPDTPIFLALEPGKKGVLLRTANACAGLEPEKLPRLFDRFYRADTSRSSGGFGVGLSLARSIVEAHRGTIRARAIPGPGIEFLVELK